ncbi:class I SAM-dependent methyltransferase [Streptomyces sp. NPDC006460]|uniref:class I SAM-dependent methyltransferase n=1 Tax=Streptomyces sp. NPDC006460 TaxID=3154304 RepID=UPI0033B26E96
MSESLPATVPPPPSVSEAAKDPLPPHSTRDSYDTVAVAYQRLLGDRIVSAPVDAAMLRAFAEGVRDDGLGPVGDLGCGTGRMAAHLRGLGADVFGVDLSPGMIAVARETYPGIRFETGTMTALDLADGSLGGVLSWYSTVHMPKDELVASFAEFHRVLAPGGRLLIGFEVGDECVRLRQAYGHEVALDVYRWPADRIAEFLEAAGLVVTARLVREPADATEKSPQAILTARKPGTGAPSGE